jgi:hypothetical protein
MLDRNLIPNVPKIGMYPATKCPEDLAFPSCMRALAEHLGDRRFGCFEARPAEADRQVQCANKFFVGISGIGFAMNWKWELGGVSLLCLDRNPEAHIRRCFDALGLDFSILVNRAHSSAAHLSGGRCRDGTAGELQDAIRSSVDRGMPCIAFGVYPVPEPCLVAGYDRGGEVLMGWNLFQGFPEFQGPDGQEECGYFRRSAWYEHTVCLVIPGSPLASRPDLGTVCREAIRAGIRLMRGEAGVFGFTSGMDGYDALVRDVTAADAFPLDDEATFRKHAEVINLITGDIAEAKCYAGDFLGRPVKALDLLLAGIDGPEARESVRRRIDRVAGCYHAIHDLMWNVWEAERGDSLTEGWPISDHNLKKQPAVRAQIGRLYARAARLEREAYPLLVESLQILDGTGSPSAPPDRVILEKVPYVGFDAARAGGTKSTYAVAALEAALEGIGEQGYTYSYLMGVTGAAFRLAWNADRWDGGNISTLWMDDDPLEPYRRAFRASGWVPELLGNPLWKPQPRDAARTNQYLGVDYLGPSMRYAVGDEDMRELLRESILGKGYPVICIGTLLPPEAGIICGYSPSSDAAYGYHHFQVFPENARDGRISIDGQGRFVKTGWIPDTLALLAFHYKGPKPSVVDTYREAMQTALRLITTPRFRSHHAGLAAYRAWREAITSDWVHEVLGDREEMRVRIMCHNDAIACLADGRAAAQDFAKEASRVLAGSATALTRVSDLYGEVAALASRMVAIQGGFRGDASVAARFAQIETRRELGAVIAQAERIEVQIAALLRGIVPQGS